MPPLIFDQSHRRMQQSTVDRVLDMHLMPVSVRAIFQVFVDCSGFPEQHLQVVGCAVAEAVNAVGGQTGDAKPLARRAPAWFEHPPLGGIRLTTALDAHARHDSLPASWKADNSLAAYETRSCREQRFVNLSM